MVLRRNGQRRYGMGERAVHLSASPPFTGMRMNEEGRCLRTGLPSVVALARDHFVLRTSSSSIMP